MLQDIQRADVLFNTGDEFVTKDDERIAFALEDSINERLKRYKIAHAICWGDRGIYTTTFCNRAINMGESLAIDFITEIIDDGLIGRIKECRCGRWFSAVRDDQKSCSAKCRFQLFESTDEAKAKRRAYMRDYYKLKKTGKVK